MASNRKNKRKKNHQVSIPIAIFITLVSLALTIFIGYNASINNTNIISISLLSLFIGLLFESFRVSKDWKTVVLIFVSSYLFSLTSFIPGRDDYPYEFERRIKFWPYYILFLFTLSFTIFNKERVIAKLTDGITLLQSLSLIYWIIDHGFTNYYNWFAVVLLIIIVTFSVFSILHALADIELTKNTRLALSVWSTIIMFLFAIDNIIRVFSNEDIETTEYLSQGLFIGLQYFLLGVSAVYTMQNFILLTEFLPSKNGNYKRELEENKKTHIDRFSDKQVLMKDSFFCILFTGIVYSLNYKYHVLPRHTMIWLVFLTFPVVLNLAEKLLGRKV